MKILLLTTYHPLAQHVGARRWALLSEELASYDHSILQITTNRLLTDPKLTTDLSLQTESDNYQYLTSSYSFLFSLKLGFLAILRKLLAARYSSSRAYAHSRFDQHQMRSSFEVLRPVKKILKRLFNRVALNRISEEKSWAKKAFKTHLSQAIAFNPDLIIASYPLWGPVFLAEKFSIYFKIPFVLDVRDPISQDHQLAIDLKRPYEKIERLILNKAAAISCINASVAKMLAPTNKDKLRENLYIIPNPIQMRSDSDEFYSLSQSICPKPCVTRNSVIKLGYFGTVHSQSLLPKYLGALSRAYSNQKSKLCIQYYGRDFQKLTNFFPESFSSCLNNNGYIDLDNEYLSVVNNIDIFIIAGFSGLRGKCVMTGKIFDYIRFGKPIVALCQHDDELSRLLIKSGIGIPFFSDDEIIEAFLDVDSLISSLYNSYKPDLNYLKKFCVDQLALDTNKLIEAYASA